MNRIKSLDNIQLSKYIASQLNHFFPDEQLIDATELLNHINQAEERVYACLESIPKKYFTEAENTYFNHLQSDQYCMYLYMLANSIYKLEGINNISTKLYYLNKSLHSVDIYFTSNLPDIFLFVHPLSTILGRATFGNYFIAYQGCTVGCLNEGIFPTIGEHVIMYANASILGNCKIGNNVCIAAGVSVINREIPDNVIVLGTYPNYKFLENNKTIFERPPFVYG